MATLITKNSSTASAVPAAGDLVKGELAVNVTDKKVYTKDNSAAVVKLVGSLGNQEANAVAITGGAINGTTIGATTPSTGAFTTASASGGFTGNLTGNVTGNVSGTAANVTGVVAIANGGTGLSALGTGVQSALGQAVTGSGSFVLSTSPSLTTPNLGTPSAAVLTNATGLPLTTGVTGTLGVANGGTGITAFGTGVATALGQNVTGSGGIVLATSPSLTTPNLGTPSAATLTNATGLPISTGVSGLGTGVATALAVNTGSAGAFVVNGGALGTPSSGTVTNLTGTASININGTVGATTPTTGAFTTLSASGNITVSGGTANGVAYLNGSKVLTTGSALTFDGTTLTASTSAAASGNFKTTSTTAQVFNLTASNDANTTIGLGVFGSAAGTFGTLSAGTPFLSTSAATMVQNVQNASGAFVWGIGSTPAEQMRLTSTGLGIGTSSPAVKLDVSGVIRSSSSLMLGTATDGSTGQFANSGGNGYLDYPGSLFFRSAASSTRLTLDSSGNLGLGVTPSAWGSTSRGFQFGTAGVIEGRVGVAVAQFGCNWFINSAGSYIYTTNAEATRYASNNGQHSWFTAPSGTAGNAISFTQALTLDASGNLLVGTTTALTSARAVFAGGNVRVRRADPDVVLGDNGSTLGLVGTINNYDFAFFTNGTERARITSGGDLLVGQTTAGQQNSNSFSFQPTTGGGGIGIVNHANGSASGNAYFAFAYNGTGIGSITQNGTTAVAFNTTSDYRLKDNPQPLTGSGAFIDALKPKTWNWTADGTKGVGFIAHEVQEVSPGSVVGTKDAVDEDGKPVYQAMEYGSAEFIANIIAELQSLRARVAQLEAK